MDSSSALSLTDIAAKKQWSIPYFRHGGDENLHACLVCVNILVTATYVACHNSLIEIAEMNNENSTVKFYAVLLMVY